MAKQCRPSAHGGPESQPPPAPTARRQGPRQSGLLGTIPVKGVVLRRGSSGRHSWASAPGKLTSSSLRPIRPTPLPIRVTLASGPRRWVSERVGYQLRAVRCPSTSGRPTGHHSHLRLAGEALRDAHQLIRGGPGDLKDEEPSGSRRRGLCGERIDDQLDVLRGGDAKVLVARDGEIVGAFTTGVGFGDPRGDDERIAQFFESPVDIQWCIASHGSEHLAQLGVRFAETPTDRGCFGKAGDRVRFTVGFHPSQRGEAFKGGPCIAGSAEADLSFLSPPVSLCDSFGPCLGRRETGPGVQNVVPLPLPLLVRRLANACSTGPDCCG